MIVGGQSVVTEIEAPSLLCKLATTHRPARASDFPILRSSYTVFARDACPLTVMGGALTISYAR